VTGGCDRSKIFENLFGYSACFLPSMPTNTMKNVFELTHPLAQHHLSILRSTSTSPAQFRTQIHLLAMLLAVRATDDLKLQPARVLTPLTEMSGSVLSQRVGIVPILRAGLGLVEPVLQLIPDAAVWHVGMYRDEATAQPVEYYSKLPEKNAVDVGLVLDPMLATGGSIKAAVVALQRWGVKDIRVLSVIAARPGIEQFHQEYPDVKVFVACIDPELNSHTFIVPGLGDAGDRMFNTLR
jgi:uracil phosphoribosyltransferase